MLDTPQQAAQAYLDHQRQQHPDQSAALQQRPQHQPQAEVVVEDETALIRSDRTATGFNGRYIFYAEGSY